MSSSSESKMMRERNNKKDPPPLPLLLSHNSTHSTISRQQQQQQQQQQNNGGGGVAGVGVGEGSDSKRVRIRQQQQRLQLLLHVSKCKHTTLCSTRFCAPTKPLWQHMKTCRNYKDCPTKHCQSSRSILTHYRMCQSQGKASTCEICGPVFDREQHNNNKIRKKTKREGQVNNDHAGLVTVNTVNSTNNNNNSNKRQNKMTMKMKIPALKSSAKGTSTKIQRRNNNMNPPSSLLLPSSLASGREGEAMAAITTSSMSTAVASIVTTSMSIPSAATSTTLTSTSTSTSTSTMTPIPTASLASGMGKEEVMATAISTSTSEVSMSTSTTATAISTATTTTTTVVATVNPRHDVFKLMDLPLPIRLDISNYAGEKQEDRIAFTLVSKQFNHDCQQPGIEWTIVPRMFIRPTKEGGGSTRTLLMNLRQKLMNNVTYNQLQHYLHMIVEDSYKFGDIYFIKYEFEEITVSIQLDRIVKLDLSHRSHSISIYASLPFALARILPNLQELDLSNNGYHRTSGNDSKNRVLSDFSIHCPQLEKITWNHIDAESCIGLNGEDMSSSKTTLRELMMDHSTFDGSFVEVTIRMSDLNRDNPTYNRQFIFRYCCKSLERVSILDAKWSKVNKNNTRITTRVLPQNALIKFVRNVPTLRWFRSDLTKENRDMLQLERPGIEFISSSN